jgi:hypothetical protein
MGFTATLFKGEGKGAWTFVTVPPDHTPMETGPWGRVPVRATVDGRTWDTSVWKAAQGECLLAVPKRIRGNKGAGDPVHVVLQPR